MKTINITNPDEITDDNILEFENVCKSIREKPMENEWKIQFQLSSTDETDLLDFAKDFYLWEHSLANHGQWEWKHIDRENRTVTLEFEELEGKFNGDEGCWEEDRLYNEHY